MTDIRRFSTGQAIWYLLAFSSFFAACPSAPLVARTTAAQPGVLRPARVAPRDIVLLQIVNHNNNIPGTGSGKGASASSPTESSTSSVGALGAASSSESSSGVTSSSSSSACVLFGGCTSSAATACQVVFDDSNSTDLNTSSSLCGSSASTDSTPFIQRTSDGGDGVERFQDFS